MHEIISPHYDDAVLSCGAFMLGCGRSTRVVTVCAGPPAAEVPANPWDRRCGFTRARAAAAARRSEDLKACSILGAEPVHLSFSERDYVLEGERDNWPTELPAAISREAVLWLPAGIGGHVDHVAVRSAFLSYVGHHRGPVRLYADCPYASAQGWNLAESDRDPVNRWQPHLDAWSESGRRVSPANIVRLDPEQASRKMIAVRCYASQVCALGARFPKLTDVAGDLATEVWWELR
jgi:LmbE family N-acetylglucosaminyl deacetylase